MSEGRIDHPVILFDGVCNLCEGFVQWVIRRDPEARYRFAPLQSDVGRTLLERCDRSSDPLDGVVLIEHGRCYRKSDAVIRVLAGLGMPYRLLSPLRILPRVIRERTYDIVATRRYGWFGRKDTCMMPTPDVQARFLAGVPGADAERDPGNE